jgi:hypothetical protein
MTKRIIAGMLLSAMMLGCHAAGIDAADLQWGEPVEASVPIAQAGADADDAKRQAALEEKSRKDEFAAAIRRGDLRQLERTLEQSPDRGAALLKDDAAPVETAASSGQKATVEFLLKRGAAVDANNGAPLKAAVRAGDIAMAELLVWRGANVNRMDRNCGTVYAMAGDAQNGDMQAKLVALGADANAARRCQAARDNGRRGSSEGAETKARAAISNETYQALRNGDYAALEKLYSRLNSDKARTPSGIWGLAVFYRALQSYPQRTTDVSYWTREEARAAEWERKFPKSPAAATYHVYVLRDRALSFRGNGYYNEIPKQNIAPMNAAIKEAYALLEKMSSKKGTWDANLYRARLEVLPYTELFHSHFSYAIEGGATMSPDYHEMYFAAALYSLPMWSGAPDGVEQVARLASKGKGADRDAMYARVYWYLDQFYYHGKIFEDSMADWDDMKTSFDALLKAYPDPWNVNAYAYFACMAKDYRVMSSLLQRIGDDLVFSVWGDNGESTYNSCVQNSGADTSNFATDLKARNMRFNEAQYYRMINYASAKRDALQTRESMRALDVARELERKVWGKSTPGMMTSYNTALTLHDLGRYDDEIAALKQGLQSQPGYQMAYYQMGLAYEKLGRKSDAREKFESAVGRPPGDTSSLDKDRRAKEEAMRAAMRAKFREYDIAAPGY